MMKATINRISIAGVFNKIVLIFSLVLIAGCVDNTNGSDNDSQSSEKDSQSNEQKDVEWKEIELTDVKTKEKYMINDFSGSKVLIENFAVWCPTCKRQQQEIKKLKQKRSDFISIGLDTDPNEEPQQVLEHINSNGFDWHFSVSPSELTQSLIDNFGVNVVNAPLAPVILICEDGSSKLLPNGVKSSDELESQMEMCT